MSLDIANKRRIYWLPCGEAINGHFSHSSSDSGDARRPRKRAKQTSLTLFPTAARHGTCESPCEASAPPPAPSRRTKPATELVGIARLAASSPCADAKRGTEYFLLPVKSILNHCDSERVPFRWTVNPYRGCEFGCHYCYARYTHEYMELDGDEFESKIYVKQDAGPLAERDLSNEKIWGEHIAIGTATDPYQPAEQEFGATRAILEKMAEREGLSVSITTKSNQVVRDIDLLQAHCGAFVAHREPDDYDAAHAAGAIAGTARAAAGSAAGGRSQAARSRDCCGSVARCRSCRDLRIGRRIWMLWRAARAMPGAVVRGKCAVPDAGFAQAFLPFLDAEISEALAAVSRVVCATTAMRRKDIARKSPSAIRSSAPEIRSRLAPEWRSAENHGVRRNSLWI